MITFDTAHINERAGIPVSETKLARIGHTLFKFALPLTGWWVSDATRILFKMFWLV